MPRLEAHDVRMNRMKTLYLQGYDLAYISEEMDCTPGYIKQCLQRMGVWFDYGGIDVPKVLALRKAGWHMAEILYELGQKYTAKQVIDAVTEYDRRHRDVQKVD